MATSIDLNGKRAKRINNYYGGEINITLLDNDNVLFEGNECEIFTVKEYLNYEVDFLVDNVFREIEISLDECSPVNDSDIMAAFIGDEYDQRKRAKIYINHLWYIDSDELMQQLINVDGSKYDEGKNLSTFKIFANSYVLKLQ